MQRISPRVLPDSPIYSSRQLIRWHVRDSALRSSVSLGERDAEDLTMGSARLPYILLQKVDKMACDGFCSEILCLPGESDAEDLTAESSWLLKKNCPHAKPNHTEEGIRAIKELNGDHSQVVLTGDKGVAMVTQTRPKHYWQTPTLKRPSPMTLPKNSKINFPKHSGTSKMKEDSVTIATGRCT